MGTLDPVLLTLAEKPIAPPSIAGPQRAHLGEIVEFRIQSGAPADRHVIHLDVIDPEGSTVGPYSGNLITASKSSAKLLPIALNDKAGVWTLQARDVSSGETATAMLQVEP